jgi:hypothetical protein
VSRSIVAICVTVICLAFSGWTVVRAGGPALRPAVAAPAAPADFHPLLNQYCVVCHNQRLKIAGLSLDTIDLANMPAQADIWERVIRKLRSGTMPPPGRPLCG